MSSDGSAKGADARRQTATKLVCPLGGALDTAFVLREFLQNTVVLFRALPPALKLSSTEKRSLQEFARRLAAQVAHDRPFTCLLTNDRELLRLNRQFLERDYPADVLSFPAGGADYRAASSAFLGELAVSVERAAAQAAEHGHALLDEIRILMLHGVLHLTGFDHERDRGEMARAERKWRDAFALPPTLIARAGVQTRLPPGVQE